MLMKRTVIGVTATMVLVLTSLAAQEPQPSCKMCPAYYIGNEELEAYDLRLS